MITRSTATTAFQTIKAQGWEVRTAGGVPEDASLMLEDLAAATDADLASVEAQTSLRETLRLTGDAAAITAKRTRATGKEDPSTLHNLQRAEAVAAACAAALA